MATVDSDQFQVIRLKHVTYIIMWSSWTRPHLYHYYNECLIVQVICQNITVPNITTETYTKYNNSPYIVDRYKKNQVGNNIDQN